MLVTSGRLATDSWMRESGRWEVKVWSSSEIEHWMQAAGVKDRLTLTLFCSIRTSSCTPSLSLSLSLSISYNFSLTYMERYAFVSTKRLIGIYHGVSAELFVLMSMSVCFVFLLYGTSSFFSYLMPDPLLENSNGTIYPITKKDKWLHTLFLCVSACECGCVRVCKCVYIRVYVHVCLYACKCMQMC